MSLTSERASFPNGPRSLPNNHNSTAYRKTSGPNNKQITSTQNQIISKTETNQLRTLSDHLIDFDYMQGLRNEKSIARVDEKDNAIKFRANSYPEMGWNIEARTNSHITLYREK